jgi:hypothetical protein
LWRLRHNTAGADIFRTDQPQPVKPLGVGEMCWGADGVHGMSSGIPWRNRKVRATALPKSEEEWAARTSAFLKAKMKECEVTYAELAKRLKKRGFKDETEAGITMKLKRGTFSATFFLACIAAMELEGVVLEEI